MDYVSEVEKIVTAHREEIEHDLAQARNAVARSRDEIAEWERRAAALEWLLTQVGDGSAPNRVDHTLHEAMAVVLQSVPERMMRAGDLAAEIDRRGLYKMRDGRPVESQQIHARVGHYPRLFRKEGTFITLADEPSS